ncbi:MAG: nucleotidyltransferase family protein [Chitinivibrionales bacterium]
MIGFVLAAGFGTRLRPITHHMPKALVPVGGVPMLKRMLDDFASAGFVSLGANIHYRPYDIFTFCDSYQHPVTLFHEKETIRGTGGALYFARDFLAGDESFCIRNVDILSDANLTSLKAGFENSGADCMLIAAAAKNNGSICMDSKTGEYRGLPQQSIERAGGTNVDYIGISFYSKRFLSFVKKDDFSLVPIWKRAADEGLRVKVRVIENMYWKDIGTPKSLADIHFDMLDKKISFTLPEDYVCDCEVKRAYPRSVESQKQVLGPYCWCDAEELSGDHNYDHCLIWQDSSGDHNRHSDAIITPWGEMNIE